MRFTVITYGSDGDTRPFATLCRGLLDAGHEVQLFAERSSLRIAQALDVPVEALAGDVQATLPLGNPRENLRTGEVIEAGRSLLRLVANNTESWLAAVAEHARTADAILFSGLAMFVGPALGLELGKPHIGLWALPISPTRAFSPPVMPPLHLPGWMNRLSYSALHATLWRYYGKPANAARQRVFGGHGRARMRLDGPILYGVSRHLVPQPPDWPATHRVCGQWFLPTAADWRAPHGLLDFLDAGPAPIYVGFGSPSSFVRQKRLDTLIAAIAGRRAVFYPGWSRIDATMLPKNFYLVRETPHSWLFPRCSVVIHHGGAGTTHTAARSGVPSIVLPFGADQFFWANRLTAAGVAPKYVGMGKIDEQLLTGMIDFTQQDAVRKRARDLGAAMSQEDGIGETVRRIEDLLRA